MVFDRDGFYRQVGLLMKRHRKGQGLTQEEVARELEMPRSTYANIERGGQRAPSDVVWRVAVLLGVPVSSLLPRPKRDEDLLGHAEPTADLTLPLTSVDTSQSK